MSQSVRVIASITIKNQKKSRKFENNLKKKGNTRTSQEKEKEKPKSETAHIRP